MITNQYVIAMFLVCIAVMMAEWTFEDGFPDALFLIDSERADGKIVITKAELFARPSQII